MLWEWGHGVPEMGVVVLLGILWAIQIGTYLFAPTGYQVSDETIIIKRPIGNIMIPKCETHSVEVYDQVSFGMRLLSSVGLFGYLGFFCLSDGDDALVYSTRWEHVVVIETYKKTIVISPEDPEEFCYVANLAPETEEELYFDELQEAEEELSSFESEEEILEPEQLEDEVEEHQAS